MPAKRPIPMLPFLAALFAAGFAVAACGDDTANLVTNGGAGKDAGKEPGSPDDSSGDGEEGDEGPEGPEGPETAEGKEAGGEGKEGGGAGILEAIPDAIDFGIVDLGSGATVDLKVRNNSGADVQIGGLTTGGTHGGDFKFSTPSALPVTITGNGGESLWMVTFAPQGLGERDGTLTFYDLDNNVLLVVPLLGVGAEPAMPGLKLCIKGGECSNNGDPVIEHNFGGLPIGQSADVEITAENTGNAVITISGAAMQPDGAGAFTIAGSLPPSLAPGESAALKVQFAPNAVGGRQGVLNITNTATAPAPAAISFSGTGMGPRACINPAKDIDFGPVPVGTTAEDYIVITSCGTEDVTVSGFALDKGPAGAYDIPNLPTGAKVLKPNDRIDLNVAMTPPIQGNHLGKLTFTTDSPGNENMEFALRGQGVIGVGCVLEISGNALDFGFVPTGTSRSLPVYVKNSGSGACNVTAANVTAGGPLFEFTPATPLPQAVPPRGAIPVTVTFTPTDTSQKTGTLAIATDDPNNKSFAIQLTANSKRTIFCELRPAVDPLDFGTIKVGAKATLKAKFTNTSGEICPINGGQLATASDSGITLVDPKQIPSLINSVDLAPGDSYEIDVQFEGLAVGFAFARLELTVGDNPFAKDVTGVLPVIGLVGGARACLSPADVQFGAVEKGLTKTRTFAIASCGNVPVEVSKIFMRADSTPEFTLEKVPTTPLSIDPGDTKNVTVRYSPVDIGDDTGFAVVTSNDDETNDQIVKIFGTGAETCGFVCTAKTLEFGQISQLRSRTIKFQCQNRGISERLVTRLSVQQPSGGGGAPYTVSHAPLPRAVAAGAYFAADVTFTPENTGFQDAILTVTSEGDACPAINWEIELSGAGKTKVYPQCRVPSTFQPVIKWEWDGSKSANKPSFRKVFMTPIVIHTNDDDGDGLLGDGDYPDVLFASYEVGSFSMEYEPAYLRALNGLDGSELWAETTHELNFAGQLAAGDIDGDGIPEIIGIKAQKLPKIQCPQINPFCGNYREGQLYAFRADGLFLWESETWMGDINDLENAGAPAIADLDYDGNPEIIFGHNVFNNQGKLLWTGEGGRGADGHGMYAIPANIDGIGDMEIVAGNTVYRSDGTILWQRKEIYDGSPSVADLDGDGFPEIILHNYEGIRTFKRDGSDFGPLIPIGSNACCTFPPTIADTTGDGLPEIVVPNGETPDEEMGIPGGGNIRVFRPDGTQLWAYPINELTGAAGPTVFDFEGDGVYEVVYADMGDLYVWRGHDGHLLFKAPRPSATGLDYPVIADIDQDGHADIVCPQDSGLAPGIRVYSNDTDTDNWISTRPVWNQHGYHVTNISDNGVIPVWERPHWKVFNTFHANIPTCRQTASP